MSDLVDARELAERLRVTTATIHAWHRRGWIPCLRAGHRPVLFDPAAVEEALRERAKKWQEVADAE
jgi:DNA-binding transcriptional MerR regulator